MQKNRNQCFAICLIFSLLVSMVPTTYVDASVMESARSAAPDYLDVGNCGVNLTYVLDGNGCLSITGEGDMTNYTDVSAVPWFSYRSLITKVSFSGNITNIGAYAFDYCVNLSSITIPDSVLGIGAYSFYGCSSLRTITIPKNVTGIGAYAFYGCTNLSSVNIGGHVTSIGVSAFAGCSSLNSITIPDSVTSIGKNAFAQCTGVSGIELSGITEIAEHAFEKSDLTEVRISGSGTVSIGNDAFSGCTSLEKVILEQCNLNTGDRVWQGCIELESVVVSAGFNEIGSSLFADCTSLSQVSLTGNCFKIGSYQFSGCTALTEITIPEGTTELGSYAFRNCTGITEIILPESVTSIQEGVFSGCSKLESLTLPFVGSGKEPETASKETLFGYVFGTSSYAEAEVVKQYYSDSSYSTFYLPKSLVSVTVNGGKLLYGAFDHCANLERITIPDTITSIEPYVFRDCKGLKGFVIANGVTELGSYAFANCTGITEITFPDSLLAIQTGAFSGCTALEKVKLPQSVLKIADNTFHGCSALQEIRMPDQIESIGAEAFRGCAAIKNISLPANLTELGDGVFQECVELQRINLPAGITDIPDNIFSGCAALQQVSIAGNVTGIGNYAFAKCTQLKIAAVPETVTEIGNYAFSGCEAIQNIKLPQKMTQIGSYAFQGCVGLTNMEIPKNVTTIGAAAFSGCSGLKSMTLPFAGYSSSASSEKSLFGYIFGSSSYMGGVATKQYHSSGYQTYYLPESLKTVTVTGGQILYGTFYNCTGITSLSIPDSLAEISDYAFYNCAGIEKMTLPKDLTKIGKCAFSGCSGLKQLIFPLSLESIGTYAFSDCSSLQDISIPGKVTGIESHLFSGCTSLKSIDIPDGVKTIGTFAFSDCSSMTDIKVPDSVTEIGSAAFSGCSSLQSMTLPFVGTGNNQTASSSKTLFGYIFGSKNYTGGTAVKQVYSYSASGVTYYIPASLKSVKVTGSPVLYGAFFGCSGLTHLELPENLTEVRDYTFYQCSGLEEISLPAGVTNIGTYAFGSCTGMKYVTFLGEAPAAIATTAFSGVTATVFYPVSDTTWKDIVGNQYGGTLTWQAHAHNYQSVVTAPSCTERGYTTHQCTRCNSFYVSDYVNALGHVSVKDPAVQASCTQTGLTEGAHCSICGDVLIAQISTQKAGHQFTEYISNEDATYEQDGTMIAECKICKAAEIVTDPGSMLIDKNKPSIEITVGTNHWTEFLHSITVGSFFKNTQMATISAEDMEKLLDGSMVSRLDSVYYYISDIEIKSQDLEQAAWKKYTNTLTLNPDKKYIVYAKAVDLSKNTTYVSSAGMIVDQTAPVMDGISDGHTYCEKAVFTVKDLSLRSVTDNGVAIEAADGVYTIMGDDKTHRIIATDDCGNKAEAAILVADNHMWKEPVFSWSDNHKSCLADYTCSRDDSHVAQVKCTVQVSSPDAGCIKAGQVVYTAIAVLDGAVKMNQQTASAAALGHDYMPKFVWATDHSACTVTLTCQRAGCKEETTGHLLGSLPCIVKTTTTAATCISGGKREVTASLVLEGVEYTDICSTEGIPVDPGNHVHTQVFNRREATCLTEGATGDVYCLDCNKIVVESTATNRLAHVWDDGKITKAAS